MRSPLSRLGRQLPLLAFFLAAAQPALPAQGQESDPSPNTPPSATAKPSQTPSVDRPVSASEEGTTRLPRPAPRQSALRGLSEADKAKVIAQHSKDLEAWSQETSAEDILALRKAEREESAKHNQGYTLQDCPWREADYSWQAQAAQWKLPDALLSQLQRDKIAYGDSSKQIFTAYLGGPAFITSDSLLNAYHILLEKSLLGFEKDQATQLKGRISFLLTHAQEWAVNDLDLPPEKARAAVLHLQRILGPAYLLQGGGSDALDTSIVAEAQEQLRLISEAKDLSRPAWLLPAAPDDQMKIDYGRFKPTGFYSSEPELLVYFKALRWLQSVPLRVKFEHEFNALCLVAISTKAGPRENPKEDRSLCHSLLGPGDDPGPEDLESILEPMWPHRPHSGYFNWSSPRTRTELCRKLIERHLYQVNSDLTAKRKLPEVFEELSFRLAPASALPEARLFQRLIDANEKPSGLAVAAWLGSSLAQGRLSAAAQTTVRQQNDLDRRPREYDERKDAPFLTAYYKTLQTLTEPPESAAPEFLRSAAWQRKTCQTILGSWIQLRHSFTLQAKENQLYFGMSSTPAGFVEPNPNFFGHLYTTCKLTQLALRGGYERLGNPLVLTELGSWNQLSELCLQLQALSEKQLRGADWNEIEIQFIKQYGENLARIMGYEGNSYLTPRDDAPRWAAYASDPGKQILYAAGIGRPRSLYVLYPWKGREILCKGAVLQYYEETESTRLTDAEWQTKLDSAAAPALPDWLEAQAPGFKRDKAR